MLLIENTIVSDDLVKIHFCCDITKCLGACCIEGDAGAPLEEEEVGIIEECYEIVKEYMTPEGIETIEKNGIIDYDSTGSIVTPLIGDRDCAFISFDGDIAKCAFEKAWLDKNIKFRKPISCHLYPVRISEHDTYDAVNYNKWHICSPAIKNGQRLGLPLYKYLEEPLIRKYGRKWYKELVNQAKAYDKKK